MMASHLTTFFWDGHQAFVYALQYLRRAASSSEAHSLDARPTTCTSQTLAVVGSCAQWKMVRSQVAGGEQLILGPIGDLQGSSLGSLFMVLEVIDVTLLMVMVINGWYVQVIHLTLLFQTRGSTSTVRAV